MELSSDKTNGDPFTIIPSCTRQTEVLGYAAGVLPSLRRNSCHPSAPNSPIVTTQNGSFTLPEIFVLSMLRVLFYYFILVSLFLHQRRRYIYEREYN